MSKPDREQCEVCGLWWFTALMPPCQHTPEEHARAAVARIMKDAAPRLRTTLQGEEDTDG